MRLIREWGQLSPLPCFHFYPLVFESYQMSTIENDKRSEWVQNEIERMRGESYEMKRRFSDKLKSLGYAVPIPRTAAEFAKVFRDEYGIE